MARRRRWVIPVAVGAAGGAAMIGRFVAEVRQMRAELEANSHLARTVTGPVEYASVGEGPAVLIVHGISGGYDQGMLVTQLVEEAPFRLIAVSRAGYLRTPLDVARTPEAQADAFAALLDTLGIKQAAIVGISGGGPSALQFALRHPERCWALIMLSAVSKRLVPNLSRLETALSTLLNYDPGLWAIGRLAKRRLYSFSGFGPELQDRLANDPARMEVIRKILLPMPAAPRRAGFYSDLEQFAAMSDYPLHEITAPTLVVHGTADTVVPFEYGQYVAERVLGAELLAIEGGGHLSVVTHKDEALPRILGFLGEHAPADAPARSL
jgi:pimeloyl-ACP methyl ester carboxylesterase